MLQRLKNWLKKNKNNFIIKYLFAAKNKINETKEKKENRKALKRLRKLKTKPPIIDRKIRVLFIVIDSNTWNKLKPLYFEMLGNNKFDVKMICCPEPFKEDSSLTYTYFKDNGYECIDARIGKGPWSAIDNKGKWFDIKNLNPDYIFYSEPYNGYLPKKYRTKYTSRYSKVCNVTYAMITTEEFLKIRPNDFYRDAYCCYANNEDEMKYNIKQFKAQHDEGIQHTKYLGFVAFADTFKEKESKSDSWDFSKSDIRAIWTPRWSTDKLLGGSNFFNYKDVLINYAKQNKDIDILFRPHPMALDNFVRTGEMTKEEVEQFRETCEKTPNLSLDKSKSYTATFWNSSFLITDISSIIVEYFVTGKPIIFCESTMMRQKSLPFFEKLISSCYVVKNKDELATKIDQLKKGQDHKKKDRERLSVELFGGDVSSAPNKIVKDIIKDATKQ